MRSAAPARRSATGGIRVHRERVRGPWRPTTSRRPAACRPRPAPPPACRAAVIPPAIESTSNGSTSTAAPPATSSVDVRRSSRRAHPAPSPPGPAARTPRARSGRRTHRRRRTARACGRPARNRGTGRHRPRPRRRRPNRSARPRSAAPARPARPPPRRAGAGSCAARACRRTARTRRAGRRRGEPRRRRAAVAARLVHAERHDPDACRLEAVGLEVTAARLARRDHERRGVAGDVEAALQDAPTLAGVAIGVVHPCEIVDRDDERCRGRRTGRSRGVGDVDGPGDRLDEWAPEPQPRLVEQRARQRQLGDRDR